MRRRLLACLTGAALVAATGAASAHHSTALYENRWLDLEGTVVEYRYANPHATIVLKAQGPGGQTTTWSLEGPAPAMLAREKWSRDTLRPGDAIKLSIQPLRSGENGGFWHPRWVDYRNGKPLSNTPCAVPPDHCRAR